jgi:hypothetical protein
VSATRRRRLSGLLVAAALGALVLASRLAASDETPTWTEVAPGVAHLRLESPRPRAELLRFDLDRYQAEVEVPGPAAPRTARALLESSGASAVVNGGFFDTEGRSLGLRISKGRVLLPLRARVDWGVLVVRSGRAQIVHSRDFSLGPGVAEGIEAALQVGPRIVVDGRPTRLKPQSAIRSAVALDRSGRRLTLLATHEPVDAAVLAASLADLGFEDALLLDGGPSAQLSARVGELRLDVRGVYPVPDLLLLRGREGAGKADGEDRPAG